MKKISVVIPTFRRAELLQKCLHRLQCQTFNQSEFEVIVVSDGEDLKTQKIIENQFPWVLYARLEQKKGPAAARNLGWKLASSPLIAFTDDDCLPDKRWLELIWNNYHGEQRIAFSGKVNVPVSNRPSDFELYTAHLATAEFITANCACTKETLICTGGFDERFEAAWREDSDLHFKLVRNNIPVLKIDALVTHPVRKARPGISLKEQEKGRYNALLFKKYPDLYRQKIGYGAPWYYYIIIFSFVAFIAAIITGSVMVSFWFFALWMLLTSYFIAKRLKSTSKSLGHISEMVYTSILIPFLSVYWQFYGAVKYRVLFI